LAASPHAPVRVLAVHGMITHEAGYSSDLQDRLAERLELQRADVTQSAPQSVTLARGYDFVPTYGAQPFDGVAKLPNSSLQ
ncbi:hypothetical protein, partial [Klebsiella pneumoniae]|uniref:hypothetical protein n=1 Tax=Klebsiella pneumoniae TaxID=573 RepID=UPI00259FE95E